MTGSINISQRDKGDKKVVLSTRLPCPQPCPACMVAFFKSYVFVHTHAILWLAISAKKLQKAQFGVWRMLQYYSNINYS